MSPPRIKEHTTTHKCVWETAYGKYPRLSFLFHTDQLLADVLALIALQQDVNVDEICGKHETIIPSSWRRHYIHLDADLVK
ncbi:MAG: hypothetical protein ACK518_04595 [bacterium]